MKYSDTVKMLIPALVLVQAEMKNVVKDKTNPYFSSKYADLASILEMARPILAKNKCFLLQTSENPGGVPTVTTRIFHESGEWVESEVSITLPPAHSNETNGDGTPKKQGNIAQKLGAIFTYLRRYSALAMLAIAAEDDDDAEQLEHETREPATPASKGAGKDKKNEAAFVTMEQRIANLPQDLKDLMQKAGATTHVQRFQLMKRVNWDNIAAKKACLELIENKE